MPKAYCVTACPKMDLPLDALRRVTPMGGLGTHRGYMEWAVVPASPGRTPTMLACLAHHPSNGATPLRSLF